MDIFSILVTLLLMFASTNEMHEVQARQMGHQNQGFPRGLPGPQQQWQPPQNQAHPRIQQSNPQFGNDPRQVAPQRNLIPQPGPNQPQERFENQKGHQSEVMAISGNGIEESAEGLNNPPPPPMQVLLDGIDHEVEDIVEAIVERLEEDEAIAIELERHGFYPDVHSSTKSIKLSGICISIVLSFVLSVLLI